MSEFPRFEYTNRDVRRAGDALRGNLIWNHQTAPDVLQVFRIANSWRDSHACPMRRLRYELIGQVRRQQAPGQTVARLKRMPSIRRKLRRIAANLNQIQDLAGCRAIVPSMKEVNGVIEGLRYGSAHELFTEDSYIEKPKSDGYRSHHMVFKFKGTGEEEVFNGRRVEIQIRSRLQHSWATAVEAVGLFRGEDLKSGQGDPDWLKLFQLMSAELALAEGCVAPAEAGSRKARIREIVTLERKLNAVAALENTRQAVRYIDEYVTEPNYNPEYYMIRYDRANGTVSVEPFYAPITGTRSLDSAEISNVEKGERNINVVLVEADGIANLKAAYPNYFGDVQHFKQNLQRVSRGGEAQEFELPPQERVAVKKFFRGDLSWLSSYRRWK